MQPNNRVAASVVLMVGLLLSVLLVVHAWDYHEARHNRIECAEFNADAGNIGYHDEGKLSLVDIDACHPSVK